MLCGVETHVCVHATTVDFISRGFQVYIDNFDDDGELVRGGKRVTTRELRLTTQEGMYQEKYEVMYKENLC